MVISNRQTAILLENIRRINTLNPDEAGASVYQEIAEISRMIDKLGMDMREALIRFHNELQDLGNRPPELPMDEPPELEVNISEPGVRIVVDGILPYPLKGSVYYLHQKLDSALRGFRQETRIPRPLFREQSAVVFLHHYRGGTRQLRDYDNTERRCILNVLTRHFLRDDSPWCIVSVDILVPGERNYTEIQIMTLPRFREFAVQSMGDSSRWSVSNKTGEPHQKRGEENKDH